MLEHHTDEMNFSPVEAKDIPISIGKIEENAQITVNDTGWTEEERERMKIYGYDDLDMVKAWYS